MRIPQMTLQTGVLGFVLLLSNASVGQNIPAELQPRVVQSFGGDMTIEDALAQLLQQTGNRVVDRRTSKTQGKISLAKKDDVPFWQALDAIVKAANEKSGGISLYELDGEVALIDRPTRSLATNYSGIFRVAVKHLSVSRDADNDKPLLTANLEFAWEPRFQPLLLAVDKVQIEYARDAGGRDLKTEVKDPSKIVVVGRKALEQPVRLEAPQRSSASIKALKGEIRVVGPIKMQTFVINPVPDKEVTPAQDKAFKVTLHKMDTSNPKRWKVMVDITPDAQQLPMFESHQQRWLAYNRAYVEVVKGKNPIRVDANPNVSEGTLPGVPDGRRLTYEFDIPVSLGKQAPANWKLVYITPARIAEFVVPFQFKDLDLP